MQAELAFGKNGLPISLPEGYAYQVIQARSAAPLADAAAAIGEALDAPVESAPLEELAQGKRTAAISVCDITRPVPNRMMLPHVLDRLHRGGIPPEGVTILIATGLHRPASGAEIREILGSQIAARYRVENHDARNPDQHQGIGKTSSGTPVSIDRRFLAAELKITLGFIEPHLMLGFSGGRKLVAPGLASQETIKALHSPRFMRDARTAEGSIDDNPLHDDLLEIARMAGHDFMLDVALARDRGIAGVFAGHPEKAHHRGARFVARVMRETLEQPADAVITTAAGYPLDLTFYQAVKGITAAAHAVKPGGRILLVAACQEGAGGAEFRQMLTRFATDREFLAATATAPVVVDQWQLEKLALVTEKARVLFYVPGLPAEYSGKLWGPVFQNIDEALARLLEGLPPRSRVAILPDGPYVLAEVAGVTR